MPGDRPSALKENLLSAIGRIGSMADNRVHFSSGNPLLLSGEILLDSDFDENSRDEAEPLIEDDEKPAVLKSSNLSLTKTTGLIIRRLIGSGLISFALIGFYAGVVPTLICMAVNFGMSYYSACLLVLILKWVPNGLNLHNAVDAAYGSLASRWVMFIFVVQNGFGSLIPAITLKQVSKVVLQNFTLAKHLPFEYYYNFSGQKTPLHVGHYGLVFWYTCVLFPLYCLSDIRFLYYPSQIGNVAIFMVVICLILTAFLHEEWYTDKSLRAHNFEPQPDAFDVNWFEWGYVTDIIKVYSATNFMSTWHTSTNMLYYNLGPPKTLKRFQKAMVVSYSANVVMSLLVLFVSIKTFGKYVNDKLTENLSYTVRAEGGNVELAADKWTALLSNGMSMIGLLMTLPQNLYYTREFQKSVIFGLDQPFNRKRHIILAFLNMLKDLGVAFFVDDLGEIVSIVGGVFAPFTTFCLPSILYLRLSQTNTSKPTFSRANVFPLLLLGVGISQILLNLVYNVMKLVDPKLVSREPILLKHLSPP